MSYGWILTNFSLTGFGFTRISHHLSWPGGAPSPSVGPLHIISMSASFLFVSVTAYIENKEKSLLYYKPDILHHQPNGWRNYMYMYTVIFRSHHHAHLQVKPMGGIKFFFFLKYIHVFVRDSLWLPRVSSAHNNKYYSTFVNIKFVYNLSPGVLLFEVRDCKILTRNHIGILNWAFFFLKKIGKVKIIYH